MSGKGDAQRPSSVPKAVADANWERTFGTKPQHDRDHALAIAKQVNADLRDYLARRTAPLANPEE